MPCADRLSAHPAHSGRQPRLPPAARSRPVPLRHVDDHLDQVPEAWDRHGGVFLPMYQAEAMWLQFDGEYPMAVKVAAGKIDALTGEGWTNELSERPQNYLPVPRSAVAGRLLRREGVDSAVRRHAPGGRLHGRGAVDRRGAARRAADRRVPDAGGEVRGVAAGAKGNGAEA